MSFSEFIDFFIKNFSKDNNVFTKSVYYANNLEFSEGGVSDRHLNMFYLRHTNFIQKFRVTRQELKNMDLETTMRLVVQLDKRHTNVLEIIKNQLTKYPQIRLNYYSDETYSIYQNEYNKELESTPQFNLYLFEFDLNVEEWVSPVDCETLC